MGFPPCSVGFRFNPTDAELIRHYLKNKILGLGQPLDGEIIDRDVYGKNATPWELFRDDDENIPWQVVVESGKVFQSQKVVYVFTKLSSVGKSSVKNKQRVAGCGSWHANAKAEKIKDDFGNGEVVGSKRIFTFSSEIESQSHWIMYEYSLDPITTTSGITNYGDYVLCKIKKDDSKISKGGRIVSRKRNYGSTVVEQNIVDNDGSTRKRMKSIQESIQTSQPMTMADDDKSESNLTVDGEANYEFSTQAYMQWAASQDTQATDYGDSSSAVNEGQKRAMTMDEDEESSCAPCIFNVENGMTSSQIPFTASEEDYFNQTTKLDRDDLMDCFIDDLMNWPV